MEEEPKDGGPLEIIYDFAWSNDYPIEYEGKKWKCVATALYYHKFRDSVINTALNALEGAEDRYMLAEGSNHLPVLDSEQNLVNLSVPEEWYQKKYKLFETLVLVALEKYPEVKKLLIEMEDARLKLLDVLRCTPVPNYGSYLIGLKSRLEIK